MDCDSNVTNVANTYLRHKVMPEAEDETIMDVAQTEYAEQITDIARFMLYLLEEKSRLFAAIRKAKDALDMDMDSEVSLNAARQSIARTFKRMKTCAALSSCSPAGAPATASTPRATRSPTAAM